MSPPRVLVVIQARAGSTRLPGKVLADLGGRPMLQLQLERLASLPYGPIVVATTDGAIDDPVADLALNAGAQVVRGPEHDVLGRFAMVLERFPTDTLVRLTGDCPLSDPAIVAAVVDLHHRSAVGYTSNVHPRTFPRGLDVEVVTAVALDDAARSATDPYDREHVMPYLYRDPEAIPIANLDSGRDLGALSWTVDTADDLTHVRRIVAELADPQSAGWREILAVPGAGSPIS